MENLKHYFQGVGLSVEDLEIIMNSFFLKEFKKDEYFIEENKISKHLGFIASALQLMKVMPKQNYLQPSFLLFQ